MVALTKADSGQDRTDIFAAVAHERRRVVLRLLERHAPVSPAELAPHLVAAETDASLLDVSQSAAERAQIGLVHVHLPTLADAGLVTWDDGDVTTTDHPALRDAKMMAMVETDAPDADGVLDSLADDCRRGVLTALSAADGPMDLTDLAAEVAADVQADGESDVATEDVLPEIHHVHLPKLEDAGLVDYDPDAETVAYEGHPDLDEEWLAADETPRAITSLAD